MLIPFELKRHSTHRTAVQALTSCRFGQSGTGRATIWPALLLRRLSHGDVLHDGRSARLSPDSGTVTGPTTSQRPSPPRRQGYESARLDWLPSSIVSRMASLEDLCHERPGSRMVAADLVVGRAYASACPATGYRVRAAQIPHVDGDLDGLEEWVPTRTVMCPWGKRQAFLRDDSRWSALRDGR
jgi:hypothetical protein